MNDESEDRISKLLPYKNPKITTRSYIKDGDLQIQLPSSRESIRAQNIETFKNIYAHYTNQLAKGKSEKKANVVEEVEHEMEEAKHNYNLMMDISNSIAEAYQDLKKLK